MLCVFDTEFEESDCSFDCSFDLVKEKNEFIFCLSSQTHIRVTGNSYYCYCEELTRNRTNRVYTDYDKVVSELILTEKLRVSDFSVGCLASILNVAVG